LRMERRAGGEGEKEGGNEPLYVRHRTALRFGRGSCDGICTSSP
jgi:hypothetical protein